MNSRTRSVNSLLLAALLAGGVPVNAEAKSYSSGGKSYSSSSSRSSSSSSRSTSSGSRSSSSGSSKSSFSSSRSSSGSSSGSKGSTFSSSRSSSSGSSSSTTFKSGGGKSYSSGSSWSDDSRKSYSSGRSYTSGSGSKFSSNPSETPAPSTYSRKTQPKPSSFSFDTEAARARKEEASQREFTRFKEASTPKPPVTSSEVPTPRIPASETPAPSYRVTPPPLPRSATGSPPRPLYVPDDYTLSTRPLRGRTIFSPYASRPVVVYRDPYNSFFWWWLLDRSLDDRAYWAYHHRHDMDPARYQALVQDNRELEARIDQLEAQQLPRDANYVPPSVDRDLMYSDQYVARTYSNRPTRASSVAFWVLAIPTTIGLFAVFIWLVFIKRWQTATT